MNLGVIEGEGGPISSATGVRCQNLRSLGIVLLYQFRLPQDRIAIGNVTPGHMVVGVLIRGSLIVIECRSIFPVGERDASESQERFIVRTSLQAGVQRRYC